MDKESEAENREYQNEELMAIEAIYPDAFEKDTSSPDAYNYTLNLDEDDPDLRSPRKLVVRFFLPPTYPGQDMPIYEIASVYCGTKKVDDPMLDAIDAGFQSLYQPGQVVLFEWISWLRDYLEDHVERPTMDRKSTFVAHVAEVHSVHEVKVVLAHLLQNKKIAKATHNILAYRIMMPDGKVLQDNDDDGESAAGGRLSHLMQILEVENVVVVVTRWFGGIHLGPDRFKDINNVARNALEECGFIKNKNTKGKKKQ
ncbi:ribosomal protein S5 domain 2-type protein [Choanephora cucurbitarum]|nr:ribosomal protein S5 domain 2-type protein [Choanephora cucurbitarum]